MASYCVYLCVCVSVGLYMYVCVCACVCVTKVLHDHAELGSNLHLVSQSILIIYRATESVSKPQTVSSFLTGFILIQTGTLL